MDEKVFTLIMAGGRGSRFWPLSREHYPKQFLRLDGGKSLLERTYERAATLTDDLPPFVSAGADQKELVMAGCGVNIKDDQVILEPVAKNTAAAIYLSALKIKKKAGNGILVVFPADHYIGDAEAFSATIAKGVEVAKATKGLVLVGIKPRYPATGYGYVERGKREVLSEEGLFAYTVRRFVEKPHRERARRYLKKGTYFWNSGIAIFPLDALFAAYDENLPQMKEKLWPLMDLVEEDEEESFLEAAFRDIEAVSFDVGILEKAKNRYLVEANFPWDDVGSYNSLSSLIPLDGEHNIIRGEVALADVRNSVVIGDLDLIAVIGLRDMAVIADQGVLLICPRKRVEEVKGMVEQLKGEYDNYL